MVSVKFVALADFGETEKPFDRNSAAIHSGNAGDVIYSVPAMQAAGVSHLFLNVYEHPHDPLRKLTETTARALVPLLLAQSFLKRVTIVHCGASLETVPDDCIEVAHVLDRFRLQNIETLHLVLAHARAIRVSVDLNKPFLELPPEDMAAVAPVVVAFTPRYRLIAPQDVSEWLSIFRDTLVLALPEELHSAAGISGPTHTCADFLEMARLIRQAPLFVGNPSLASAIAEGLKGHRVVDLPVNLANAFPTGPRGYLLPTNAAAFRDLVARIADGRPRLAIALWPGEAASTLRSRLSEAEAKLQHVETTAAQVANLSAGDQRPDFESKSGLPMGTPVTLKHILSTHSWIMECSDPSFVSVTPEGVFLHPDQHGSTVTTITVEDFPMTERLCFKALLTLEHSASQPVRFIFEVEDEKGNTLLYTTASVLPEEPMEWQVLLPVTPDSCILKLSTVMRDTEATNLFAWAWLKNPEMVRLS